MAESGKFEQQHLLTAWVLDRKVLITALLFLLPTVSANFRMRQSEVIRSL